MNTKTKKLQEATKNRFACFSDDEQSVSSSCSHKTDENPQGRVEGSAQLGEGCIFKLTQKSGAKWGLIKTDFDDTITFAVDAIRPKASSLAGAFLIGQRVKFSATKKGLKWSADLVCAIESASNYFHEPKLQNDSFFGASKSQHQNSAQNCAVDFMLEKFANFEPLHEMSDVHSADLQLDFDLCQIYSEISRNIAKTAHSFEDEPESECPLCLDE